MLLFCVTQGSPNLKSSCLSFFNAGTNDGNHHTQPRNYSTTDSRGIKAVVELGLGRLPHPVLTTVVSDGQRVEAITSTSVSGLLYNKLIRKLGVEVHSCNPSIWDVEVGGSRVPGQHRIQEF